MRSAAPMTGRPRAHTVDAIRRSSGQGVAVSLTGHLSAGALARFFTAECPGTRKLCGEIAALQADRRPIGPQRGGVGGDYWAAVGGAFGQRLAFFVQPAPPYYALLGAARIASLGWTDLAHRRFPTHAAL